MFGLRYNFKSEVINMSSYVFFKSFKAFNLSALFLCVDFCVCCEVRIPFCFFLMNTHLTKNNLWNNPSFPHCITLGKLGYAVVLIMKSSKVPVAEHSKSLFPSLCCMCETSQQGPCSSEPFRNPCWWRLCSDMSF